MCPIIARTVVYGPWPWVAYPPYYFPALPGFVAFNRHLRFRRRPGRRTPWYWGWGLWDWHRHGMFIDGSALRRTQPRHDPAFRGAGVWAHDPGHRHGVPYGNAAVRAQYQGRATRRRVRTIAVTSTRRPVAALNSNVHAAASPAGTHATPAISPRTAARHLEARSFGAANQQHTAAAPALACQRSGDGADIERVRRRCLSPSRMARMCRRSRRVVFDQPCLDGEFLSRSQPRHRPSVPAAAVAHRATAWRQRASPRSGGDHEQADCEDYDERIDEKPA